MTVIAPPATIAFIGLGMMGKPMASRLAAAGFKLRLYDLSQKAVSVILSHNHVDAYALPSREDELTTRRIRDALLLVGITLADHIIVCGEDYVSFADSGLL